jgi:hypothetical protein
MLTRVSKTFEKLMCGFLTKHTSEAQLFGFGLTAHTREWMWFVAKVWPALCYRLRTARAGIWILGSGKPKIRHLIPSGFALKININVTVPKRRLGTRIKIVLL